jgi:hypothetical protein
MILVFSKMWVHSKAAYLELNRRENMNIVDAQREMRSAFLGGFGGQLISGLIWLAATVVGTVGKPGQGMAILFFGSMLIFPLTQWVVRRLGRPGRVGAENKLWGLGSQIAFTVPINFLLVGAAALYREHWFFPTAMIVVGAHYLPFLTLYGMKMFGVLAILLIGLGTGLVFSGITNFGIGGWVTAAILIVFAFIGRQLILHEERSQ